MTENQNSKSISTAHTIILGGNIPVVHHLSGNILEKNGWVRAGTTYTKGSNVIEYNGYQWRLNKTTVVEFYEDLKDLK